MRPERETTSTWSTKSTGWETWARQSDFGSNAITSWAMRASFVSLLFTRETATMKRLCNWPPQTDGMHWFKFSACRACPRGDDANPLQRMIQDRWTRSRMEWNPILPTIDATVNDCEFDT